METNKYVFCGEENLCHTYKGDGISQKGKDLFNKWGIESLADPCLHEKEAFLDMPVSPDRRLFVRAIRERKKGSRTLTWYLGVEFSKAEIQEASCYANLVRGVLSLTLDSLKNLLGGGELFINLQYPSGLPQIQTPFDELNGKNFYGEYPRVLWEFCQKISLNDIEDWFNRLFLAVNVEIENPEYTNMVCAVPPQKLVPREPVVDNPTVSESHAVRFHPKKSIKKKNGKMKNVFFCAWFVVTVVSVYWNFSLSGRVNALEQNDQTRQGKIESMTTNQEFNTKINEVNERIEELNTKIDAFNTNYGWIKDLNIDIISDLQKSFKRNKVKDYEKIFDFLVGLFQNEDYLQGVIEKERAEKNNSNKSLLFPD